MRFKESTFEENRKGIREMVFYLALVCILWMPVCFAHGQSATIQLWPKNVPDPQPVSSPEHDESKFLNVPGHNPRITDISNPTMLVYPPDRSVANSGAAILMFPGGAYRFLNMKNAGTVPCTWANSLGMTCFIVKYRVPVVGYYPEQHAPLDDAQQAMRIVRSQADKWHIDPKRIGIMGFSAGGNLVVLLNTHPDDDHVMRTSAANEVPRQDGKPVDARSDFTIACWPAFLPLMPDQTKLNPVYDPNSFTPPTFLIQAEDDRLAHNNAIVYYRALMDAKIPAEMHYYATGGHAFGMYPKRVSQAGWADIAANWLRFNHIIPESTGSTQ